MVLQTRVDYFTIWTQTQRLVLMAFFIFIHLTLVIKENQFMAIQSCKKALLAILFIIQLPLIIIIHQSKILQE
ncbi:MAG: hypothetical protein CME98_16065 [Hyphomonas sp.]|nr:hypothetical protein [Hyphomonas sp.]